ncbi:hypothetical protein M758_UG116000 [Ceratodon purpureus]|nr:hypothetical protein M758_UG116000 [Ceratodon purpureus]
MLRNCYQIRRTQSHPHPRKQTQSMSKQRERGRVPIQFEMMEGNYDHVQRCSEEVIRLFLLHHSLLSAQVVGPGFRYQKTILLILFSIYLVPCLYLIFLGFGNSCQTLLLLSCVGTTRRTKYGW